MFPSFITSTPPSIQASTNADNTFTNVMRVDTLRAKTFALNATAGAQSVGSATLVAGVIVVTTSSYVLGDFVFVTLKTPAGTVGVGGHKVSAVADGAFTITSVIADGTTQASDTSVVNYMIVKPSA
jgi:hypothetical protein